MKEIIKIASTDEIIIKESIKEPDRTHELMEKNKNQGVLKTREEKQEEN